ncbi:hypothetical protein [Paraconexibacter algicola]|uniref:DUF7064 domain-containing protein n=1 Tax=Paraconexibacter algicola TaxID=2133960 RepID=A0A2T4UGU6_9ACTN|nr:hypothetical protein [Paraconexibacter algicola]PTL58425.1 hypothetical protein C7Y72_01540 [Paraconexibacter algicola]
MAPQPDAADEGRHAPGPEPLWNESWYFDAVSASGDLGVYARLGRLPNQGVALLTVCVTGPGRPSVMLAREVPLPDADDDTQAVTVDGARYRQSCEEPLRRWRLSVDGIGEAHADHAAPLHGGTGVPTAVALELEWTTDGTPYRWRHGNRYEVPCRVAGTVRVGEEQLTLAGVGQRDHSWGARDWWAVEWMWSALHLDDGTHLHAVGIPGVPQYSVGYVQRDGLVHELSTVVAQDEVAPDGLIVRCAVALAPDAPDLAVEPLAFGCVRLDAPDGRVSWFPRALCRVRTDDGRTGLGWVEWNRLQR